MIDLNKFLATYKGQKDKGWQRLQRDRQLLRVHVPSNDDVDVLMCRHILTGNYGQHYAKALKVWIETTYGIGKESAA